MSTVRSELVAASGQVIQIRQGDLTQEDSDAIVNAANSYLEHGGGVAGAIVRRGGDSIQQESDQWMRQHGNVPAGQVAVTGAGRLPCKVVIHAVGPIWEGGGQGEDELLRQAVWHSLLKANELQLSSISIPAISSGIFGFPKPRCAQILVKTALDFCAQYPGSSVREIRFTNIDDLTVRLFAAELSNVAGES